MHRHDFHLEFMNALIHFGYVIIDTAYTENDEGDRMRVVPIEFANGHVLAEDLYDINGRMLLKLGSGLTENNLDKIRLNGIFSLYIHDKYSLNSIEPPLPSDLKNVAILEMKYLFEEVRKTKLPGGGNFKTLEKHLNKIMKYADDIMYELPKRQDHYINFVDVKSVEMYTYAHSINVAVLSYMLAKDAKIDPARWNDLFIGALFQDLGMSFINENLFMKKGKLDVKEFVKIKEHPKLGYEFIKDLHFANSYIKVIIYQHQERIDGSGYPNGIEGHEMNPLAKLVAIADVYDAMTSDRVYARAVSPSNAIEYLMGAAGRHFDFDMTNTFIQKIMPYPIGSLVKMNTGDIALIEEINRDLPLRPVIRLIDQTTKELERTTINLMSEHNLIIDEIQYECP